MNNECSAQQHAHTRLASLHIRDIGTSKPPPSSACGNGNGSSNPIEAGYRYPLCKVIVLRQTLAAYAAAKVNMWLRLLLFSFCEMNCPDSRYTSFEMAEYELLYHSVGQISPSTTGAYSLPPVLQSGGDAKFTAQGLWQQFTWGFVGKFSDWGHSKQPTMVQSFSVKHLKTK